MCIYEFFKNHPRRGVFRNVNLSNLENVLQKNRRTDLAEECIFRASGGTNFENFCDLRQPWCRPLELDVCTGLPKKTLDTSLSTNKPHRASYFFVLQAKHKMNLLWPKS